MSEEHGDEAGEPTDAGPDEGVAQAPTEEGGATEEPAPQALSPVVDLPPAGSVPRPEAPKPIKVYPPATVQEIEPDHGSVLGDTRLTLRGDNLLRESIVRIDGVIARPVGASEPRELRVMTPPRSAAGPVDVSVTNPHAEPVVLSKAFRYEPFPPPKISSVAPDHVPVKGGGELTIVGESFAPKARVLFDGEPVEEVRFVDATTLDVKTPPGQEGKVVDVTVENPDGKRDVARRAFMYDPRFD